MGRIKPFEPVKGLVALTYISQEVLQESIGKIETAISPISERGPDFPFTFTDYYKEEMGGGLRKTFFSLTGLHDPSKLSYWKIKTGEIEDELKTLSCAEGRTVNIDPGFIDGARIVLASTKDHSHRIALRGGIYGEITLIYEKKAFRILPWTYPDYKEDSTLKWFSKVRESFLNELKRKEG